MPGLIWSPSSLRDLRSIHDFFLERDSIAGLRMLRTIRAAADRLRDYPRIGRAFEEPFRVLGIRGTPYLLIYRLREEDVEVVRIRHGRENWLYDTEAAL